MERESLEPEGRRWHPPPGPPRAEPPRASHPQRMPLWSQGCLTPRSQNAQGCEEPLGQLNVKADGQCLRTLLKQPLQAFT